MPKISVIIVFILILVIIVGFVLLTPHYAQISELRNEIASLETLQQQQREEIKFLQKEIDALHWQNRRELLTLDALDKLREQVRFFLDWAKREGRLGNASPQDEQ